LTCDFDDDVAVSETGVLSRTSWFNHPYENAFLTREIEISGQLGVNILYGYPHPGLSDLPVKDQIVSDKSL
jgi:hypothetical protein